VLSRVELVEIFDQIGMPTAGRQLVERARVEEPVRKVKSSGGNVLTYMASRKMGREIGTESLHVEFPAALNHEFDFRVREFYPQPFTCRLNLIDDDTGEVHEFAHTPDFLVIRDQGFTVEEWKSEQRLISLAKRAPWRYQRGKDHKWRSPLIEKYFADRGFEYQLRSDSEIPRRRVENLRFLRDYHAPGAEPCPPEELARLKDVLAVNLEMFLAELFVEPYRFERAHVYKAIADNQLVTNFDQQLITTPKKFRIFRDEGVRDFKAKDVSTGGIPGCEKFMLNLRLDAAFVYGNDTLKVAFLTDRDITFRDQNGEMRTVTRTWLKEQFEKGKLSQVDRFDLTSSGIDLKVYSDEQLKFAVLRHEALDNARGRTARRDRQKVALAKANGQSGVEALLRNTHLRGNRESRLDEGVEEIMRTIFLKHWLSSAAKNKTACYGQLLLECANADLAAPSRQTFGKRIDQWMTDRGTCIREGKRRAYQHGEFVQVLHHETPVHGSRPFQYIHIDHTQVDMELISEESDQPLGRPWLTLAVDAYSRRIVGFYLSYEAPSYTSVMMVCRDMVFRFNRLPECMVVDNGMDFRSSAFRTYLRSAGVDLRFRPAHNPRHGAVMERLFGTANKRLFHNLPGNTKLMRRVREVTGTHLPKNLAEWTLRNLIDVFSTWATEIYDGELHATLQRTPKEAFEQGMHKAGSRPHTHIAYNEYFLISTCPPVDAEGTRIVDRQRGVKVKNFYYRFEGMQAFRVGGKKVQVRYDPWDVSTVYVRHKNDWISATCPELAGMEQMSMSERKALTQECHLPHKSKDELRAARMLNASVDKVAASKELKKIARRRETVHAVRSRRQGGISDFCRKSADQRPAPRPVRSGVEGHTPAPAEASASRQIESPLVPSVNFDLALGDVPSFDSI
jgi:putative transposase